MASSTRTWLISTLVRALLALRCLEFKVDRCCWCFLSLAALSISKPNGGKAVFHASNFSERSFSSPALEHGASAPVPASVWRFPQLWRHKKVSRGFCLIYFFLFHDSFGLGRRNFLIFFCFLSRLIFEQKGREICGAWRRRMSANKKYKKTRREDEK